MTAWTSQIVRWQELNAAERQRVLQRPAIGVKAQVTAAASEVLGAVRERGDAAVREFAQRYDGFAPSSLRLSAAEWEDGLVALGTTEWNAIKRAAEQIERFHAAEKPHELRLEVSPGIVCQRLWRPLQRVGLYVPAGTAPLPSTVLMLGIPARLAGCRERIICTPVGPSDRIHPGILAAARLAGITEIYKIGGAQAVAAMAYGTESVAKVDKIFGPGNSYVTQAKALVAQDPAGAASDLPAGPSEVMVIADGQAVPAFAAADLLSQAEHGSDSHVVLVALTDEIMRATLAAVETQLARLPRSEIARQSLAQSAFIVAASPNEALAIANAYAPEHLILQLQDAASYLPLVEHAGSVFVGAWSPEAVGDYASGTNHVLPTYGLARSHGGLSMESFMKSMTVQELSPQGLRDIAPTVDTLAMMEGLQGHAEAVRTRVAYLQKTPELAGGNRGI